MPRTTLTLLLAGLATAASILGREAPAPPTAPPKARTPPASRRTVEGCLEVETTLDRSAIVPVSGAERFATVVVKAAASCQATRPVDLALVLDTSGSMAPVGKLDAARRAAEGALDALVPGDRASVTTFADEARLLAALGTDPVALRPMLRGLRAHGATNLHDGLAQGIESVGVAPERAQRVVVMTDGIPTVGARDLLPLASLAGNARPTVSTIGLGTDYDERLLTGIANQGRGWYYFAETGADLDQTFEVELERARGLTLEGTVVWLTPSPGWEVAEVMGWSHQDSARATRISIGDLSRGEHRRMVVRLSATEDLAGPVSLATHVSARGPGETTCSAGTSLVATPASDAEAWPANGDVLGAVERAGAAEAVAAAHNAWAAGDHTAATRTLEAAAARLRAADIPEQERIEALGYLQDVQSAPSPEAAQKEASEALRSLGYL